MIKFTKRHESTKKKQSLFREYILRYKKHWRLPPLIRRTQNLTIIDQEKINKTRTNLHVGFHEYQINYVNSDSRHQYGIFEAESQTSLSRNVPGGEETRKKFIRRLERPTQVG